MIKYLKIAMTSLMIVFLGLIVHDYAIFNKQSATFYQKINNLLSDIRALASDKIDKEFFEEKHAIKILYIRIDIIDTYEYLEIKVNHSVEDVYVFFAKELVFTHNIIRRHK